MVKYLVGGYYDSRIFLDYERVTPFDENIFIYNLDEALELAFVENVYEWYDETKEDDQPSWDDLSYDEKVAKVLNYVESDDMSGLIEFDNLEQAIEYIKKAIEELTELKFTFEYVGKIQDSNGYYVESYRRKENK